MKIFSAEQIRKWDGYTIQNEPVSSIDLMERAAFECSQWIIREFHYYQKFAVFCGPGNNGGDGLAIARMLKEIIKCDVRVFLLSDKKGSEDFETNLSRLKNLIDVNYLHNDFPEINGCIVIDAIFGTGLNKPVTGAFAKVIENINHQNTTVISIDIPSGMYVDKSSIGNKIIQATHTLTFQNQKLAFFMPENGKFCGKVELLPIGLSKDFEENEEPLFYFTDESIIKRIYRSRDQFSNKGNYGYACMLAGSYGMMGAAILSAHGCLRSGVGKMTCYVCETGYEILQIGAPEALCKVFGKKNLENISGLEPFDALGIGPGIGQFESHVEMLNYIFGNFKKPVVIDADALNVMSEHQELYKNIPENSIITPHPKEFERLFGKTENDFAQRDLAVQKAAELKVFIILKGRYTFIATSEGKGFFNSTGNPGMATAGSGDVLTGILTGLLAQHYSPFDTCILGVYLHGLAGDFAAQEHSQEALISEDIYRYLGKAFLKIKNVDNP